MLGDDREVIVIDAAHEAQPIIDAVDGRKVKAIVCTHAHNDHITVAPELQEKLDAPLLVHPGDQMLWEQSWPNLAHEDLAHGQRLEIAGMEVVIINTPGHSPGSCCLYVPEAAELFSGDTLFSGGPGATGRSYSDFDTIINSIRDNLLTLPAETTVRTGHGIRESIAFSCAIWSPTHTSCNRARIACAYGRSVSASTAICSTPSSVTRCLTTSSRA